MQGKISEHNIFCNAVISRQLDSKARLWAKRFQTSRSKFVALALADFVTRLESDPVRLESEVKHERQLA